VRQAAAAWRERAERNPHRFNRVEIGGLVAAARERAAGFLGVDPSRAAWVRNVSEGVSAVLGSLELHPGDEMVISTHGYGAVRKALSHHAARAGARIVEAAYAVGAADDVIVSAYAAACSRRTRLVVIDRITSPTATVIPVAAVAAAVAAAAASVLVDNGVDPFYEALSQQRVEVAPVHFGGVGYLRIAAAPYNTPYDYDRLAGTVRELLDRRVRVTTRS